MTRQHEFSRKVMVAAFQRAGTRCEKCATVLRPGKFQYDHIIPQELGGESTLENCQVLCSACHDAKTFKQDIPAIAKSNRVRAKHLGAVKPKGRPIPGSKASGWRKKLDGTVERR
jgi:5-methylcytosine-specific restriction protein A